MPEGQVRARPPPGVTACESFFRHAITAVINYEEMEPNLIVEIDERTAVVLAHKVLSMARSDCNRIVIIDISCFPTIGAYVLKRELSPDEGVYEEHENLVGDECIILMVNNKEKCMCSRIYNVPT